VSMKRDLSLGEEHGTSHRQLFRVQRAGAGHPPV